jgi:hypothetical protein
MYSTVKTIAEIQKNRQENDIDFLIAPQSSDNSPTDIAKAVVGGLP